MGYFTVLAESMFDSVLFARDKVAQIRGGILLPNKAKCTLLLMMKYYKKETQYFFFTIKEFFAEPTKCSWCQNDLHQKWVYPEPLSWPHWSHDILTTSKSLWRWFREVKLLVKVDYKKLGWILILLWRLGRCELLFHGFVTWFDLFSLLGNKKIQSFNSPYKKTNSLETNCVFTLVLRSKSIRRWNFRKYQCHKAKSEAVFALNTIQSRRVKRNNFIESSW